MRHVSQSFLYTMPNSRPVYSNQEQQGYGYSRRTDRDQYSGTVDQELTSVQFSMESTTISHSSQQFDLIAPSERRRRRQQHEHQDVFSQYEYQPKRVLHHSNKWQQPVQQNDQELFYSQEMTASSYPTYQQNPIGYSGLHQHDTRHLAHSQVQDMHFSNLNNSAAGHKNVLLIEELCSPVDSNQNVYVANQQCTFKDEKNFLRKAKIGQENATRNQQQKVIMLLGETGSGKSTLINVMFNYIMGVEFEDNFRLNLIGQEKTEHGYSVNQAKSQTK